MNVPKEVIIDLLPVYLAGEASPVTRAWLEEYLARYPDLADQVRRQTVERLGEISAPSIPPELELRTLQRTRRTITQLRWLFGLSMSFTAIALALEISFRPFQIRPLLLDYPAPLLSCFAVGVVCWIAYYRLRRRLSRF